MNDEPKPMSAAYPVPSYMANGVVRARNHITRPGANWSASERTDIASVARAARSGEERPEHELPRDVAAMAELLANDAHSIDQERVNTFVDAIGRGIAAYVEMLGVVARIVAIDTFAAGIGADLMTLSAAPATPPAVAPLSAGARKRSAFVPTVGPAGATTALSLVASEDAAQEDLHGSLYLSYAEMGDLHIVKGLPRWQLELVAARTSLLNSCFF